MSEISCPSCQSQEIRKAGILRRKKLPDRQQYQCKECKRVFVLESAKPGPEIIINGGIVSWKQRIFRSAPDLDSCIDADSESFQKIVDSCLRQRYNLPNP